MDPDLRKCLVQERNQSRNTNNFDQKEKGQVKAADEDISLRGSKLGGGSTCTWGPKCGGPWDMCPQEEGTDWLCAHVCDLV